MIPTLSKIIAMLTGKRIGRRGHGTHIRHYYRAGGALLARGKYNPPDQRHICFGENGCNCWKHLKHVKRNKKTGKAFITS